MSCDISSWTAHVHGEGNDRTLHVLGEGKCTSTGHVLRLEPAPDGIVDDPDLVAFTLEVDESEVGHDTVTPEKVEARLQIGDDPATKVVIRGAASATVPIDLGSGA